MCGIAGTFGSVSPAPEDWLPWLWHRGPDGEGTWTSRAGRAALAHTRLAIIDPHPEADQPMSSGCGRWHLVFNGEIYNYRELREELEGTGVGFRTESDTEVLLQGLAREGKEYLRRLAGMYAFAFWDEEEGKGLLARDPFGIKPLYVRKTSHGLAFASEVKALQGVSGGGGTDRAALVEHLRWGSVPEPLTLDSSIRQLRSGHWMEWGREEGGREMAYFSVDFGRAGGGEAGGKGRGTGDGAVRLLGKAATVELETDAVGVTRKALLESVERHLVSDVPVGIFLSGGIDSTAVLALAREVLGKGAEIRTFSIGFEDPAYDESSLARRTAEQFGAEHLEWSMTREEGMAEIPGYLAAMDQPTNDGFNTWCVSKLVRESGVKVALSGLGGDELFGGYPSFAQVPRLRRAHAWLGPLRAPVAAVLDRGEGRWRRLAAFLRSRGGWWEAFHAQRGIFTRQEAEEIVERILGKQTAASGRRESEWEAGVESAGWSDGDRVSWMELTCYMRHQLLRDSDVFSMARGLELRVPLVDERLFQAVSAIPAGIRLRPGKRLLWEAVPEVPQWVWDRPKQGFRFPFAEWMEEGFGELLGEADGFPGVGGGAWYRRWTLGAALGKLGMGKVGG